MHGKKYEDIARQKFSKIIGFKIVQSGLLIDKNHPFLGCSPDGFYENNEKIKFIIEIKCPYIYRKYTSKELKLECKHNKSECFLLFNEINNRFELKTQHNYYYQIQGLLAISKASKCNLIVYLSENDEIVLVEIYFNIEL